MSWFSNLVSTVQNTVQDATKSIVDQAQAAGQSISGAFQQAQTAVGNAADVVKYAALLPFKTTMIKALNRKGIPFQSNNIADISNKFYDYVVKKKSNYDELDYKYSLVDNFDTIELVGSVLAFIKNLMNMDEKGETLTAEQKAILGDAKTDAANVPSGNAGIPVGFNPAEANTMDKGNWVKWVGIGAVVILVIYMFSRKK